MYIHITIIYCIYCISYESLLGPCIWICACICKNKVSQSVEVNWKATKTLIVTLRSKKNSFSLKYFPIEQKTLDKYFNYQILLPAFGCEPEYSCRVLFCFSSLLLPLLHQNGAKICKTRKISKKAWKTIFGQQMWCTGPIHRSKYTKRGSHRKKLELVKKNQIIQKQPRLRSHSKILICFLVCEPYARLVWGPTMLKVIIIENAVWKLCWN